MVTALLTLELASCADASEADTDYDVVTDVPVMGWTEADTLCFAVQVAESVRHTPVPLRGIDYRLRCSVRIQPDYAFAEVPMLLIVQQTDTAGLGQGTRVVRNLMRRNISVRVRDAAGHPLGPTWGSMAQHEEMIDSLTLRFDTTGSYRLLLLPRAYNHTSLPGITAIGISLNRSKTP